MARDQRGGYLARPAPSGLADVVEIILDKGLVLDAYVRVALLGIELLTVDTRMVVASVDTYLRFAEATNRLDLVEVTGPTLVETLEEGAEAMVENVATNVAEDKVEGAVDRVGDTLGEPAKKLVRGAGGKILDVAQDVAELASDTTHEPGEG
jgi:gas vesicle structural protein